MFTKHMKHWLATIGMILYSLTTSAYDFEVDGIRYNILSATDLTAEVTASNTEYSGDIVIPATVAHEGNTYSVTSIGYRAFHDCENIKAVQIPQSVKSIGIQAFAFCSSLISIEIPDGVRVIPYGTFMGCNNLSSITIPNSVVFIGENAFDGTAWYDNQPDGVIYIGSVLYEFKGVMPENSSIHVKEGTTGISGGAFRFCAELASISIPESVSFMGNNVFNEASPWYENLPEGLIYIGNVLYKYKGELPIGTSITVNEGTTAIAGGAFYGCSNLTAINLPETIISLGERSFSGCSGLTSIYIQKNVEWIEIWAFEDCSNLVSITVHEENTNYDSRNNCNAIIETANNRLILGCGNTVFPAELNSIGVGAFWKCNNLTSVVIPMGVDVIEVGAFYYCKNLTSVTIPKSVHLIDWYAFNLCDNLSNVYIESIEAWCGIIFPGSHALFEKAESIYLNGDLMTEAIIPSTVTSIGYCAFSSCRNLHSVVIGGSVTSIGGAAFYDCEGLTSIVCKAITPPMIADSNSFYGVDKSIPVYVPAASVEAYKSAKYWNEFANIVGMREVLASGTCGTNQTWTLYTDGELIIEGTGAMNNYSSTGEVPWYGYETSIKTVTIKEGVTSIGDYAFWGCSNLTSIDIPKGVESIGKYAFCGCNLIRITISTSVTSIGEAAFANNPNLAEIMVEQGNAHYDSRNNCNAIIETANSLLVAGCAATLIPEGVTAIGYGAFAGTKGLSSIFIPKNVNTIRANAFQCCDNLTEVNCAENSQLTSIGVYAFSQCRSLTSINIPEGVTSIGAHAFMLCTSLTSIVIPESVTEIGGQAFDRTGLSSITCKATTPPSNDYGIEAFSGVDKSIPVYVPAESVEAYKAAEYWKEFTNIQPIEDPLPATVTITINQYGSGTYSSEYALDFSEVKVLKAYVATGYNHLTGEVTLLRVHTAEAGMGLLVKGTPGVSYEVPILESTADHTLNMLVATLEKTKVNGHSDDGVYANYKYTVAKEQSPEPLFYQFADGASLSAGKAYLQIPVAWLPDTGQKSLRYRFDEGETTDIEDEEIINYKSEIIYDLYGRRVLSPKKGEIYIINNQKVIY